MADEVPLNGKKGTVGLSLLSLILLIAVAAIIGIVLVIMWLKNRAAAIDARGGAGNFTAGLNNVLSRAFGGKGTA